MKMERKKSKFGRQSLKVGSDLRLIATVNNIGKENYPGGYLNFEIKWMNGLGGRGQMQLPAIPPGYHRQVETTQVAQFTGDGIVSTLVTFDNSGAPWSLFFGDSASPPKGIGSLDGFPFTIQPKVDWVAWGTLLVALGTLVVTLVILVVTYYKL